MMQSLLTVALGVLALGFFACAVYCIARAIATAQVLRSQVRRRRQVRAAWETDLWSVMEHQR